MGPRAEWLLPPLQGHPSAPAANLDVDTRYEADFGDERGIALIFTNRGRAAIDVTVFNIYTNEADERRLGPGQDFRKYWSLHRSFGWYDLVVGVEGDETFEQRVAGHVENGNDSVSDPAL